jgi:signal transduction histidine kinase
MLDDLGLQPALEWHVRDVSRRYGIPVELTMHGDFDSLPDAYRTCVYRAVQEALTNCVRHAQARSIAVVITAHASELEASVTDDGIGLPRARKSEGLGLRGIEERVKKLDGVLQIRAAPGRGTTLALRVPLPVDRMDVPLARAAG